MSETVSASTAQRTPTKPVARQPTRQRGLTSCVTVGPAVKWPAHHQRRATLRVHRFVLCPVSAVWNHPSRKNLCQKPFWRQGAGGTVGLLWHTRTRCQPSALFRSEGCGRHELGVNPPLFFVRRAVSLALAASSRLPAARRAGLWFLFSSSFPFLFCHAASRGQY